MTYSNNPLPSFGRLNCAANSRRRVIPRPIDISGSIYRQVEHPKEPTSGAQGASEQIFLHSRHVFYSRRTREKKCGRRMIKHRPSFDHHGPRSTRLFRQRPISVAHSYYFWGLSWLHATSNPCYQSGSSRGQSCHRWVLYFQQTQRCEI
jgi:hypothetical protein